MQTTHCIYHTQNYILLTKYCILQTAHCPLHTVYCILHTAHCILQAANCSLNSLAECGMRQRRGIQAAGLTLGRGRTHSFSNFASTARMWCLLLHNIRHDRTFYKPLDSCMVLFLLFLNWGIFLLRNKLQLRFLSGHAVRNLIQEPLKYKLQKEGNIEALGFPG